ncbi:unnamed protein product [Callosobruchus maculatus]|uniref:Uncharacterized protein n=1 Tax=Callosobruchus maculatus TaxID=64391 RepID=A0A653BDH3_CALMS|nr:unnamed protein product [Callosobruchus maculatus]
MKRSRAAPTDASAAMGANAARRDANVVIRNRVDHAQHRTSFSTVNRY